MVTRLGPPFAKWTIYICEALIRTYYNTTITTTTILVTGTEKPNCADFLAHPASLATVGYLIWTTQFPEIYRTSLVSVSLINLIQKNQNQRTINERHH